MNIFVNAYDFILCKKNTDWQYSHNFKEFSRYTDNVTIKTNSNFICIFLANFFYVAYALLRRISPKLVNTNFIKKIQLKAFIAKKDILWADVIFCHGNYPTHASKYNIPTVFDSSFTSNELCGAINDDARKNEIEFYSEFYSLATLVTFTNKYSVNHFNRLCDQFSSKIKVAPFFLPNLTAVSNNHIQKKNNSSAINILFAGRDARRKGIEKYIEAINILFSQKTNFQNCTFTFITDYHFKLPQEINYKQLPPMNNDKVLKCMKESHIFIMPTLRESYGLVYIEAMASGCAIIADNKQPRIEIFDSGKAGILVNPLDTNKIAKELLSLITNKERRINLAMNALERFKLYYSPEIVAQKYNDSFKEAIRLNTI